MELQDAKWYTVSVMFYGGLMLCAAGIEGVSFFSGFGLGMVIHGMLLAKREGAW
jgi:hypothetical protein